MLRIGRSRFLVGTIGSIAHAVIARSSRPVLEIRPLNPNIP